MEPPEFEDQDIVINLRRKMKIDGGSWTLAARKINLHIDLHHPTSGPLEYTYALSFRLNSASRTTCPTEVEFMLLDLISEAYLDVHETDLNALLRLICRYCDASLDRIQNVVAFSSRRLSLHVYVKITLVSPETVAAELAEGEEELLGRSPAAAAAIESLERVIYGEEDRAEAGGAAAMPSISSCAICLDNFEPAAELAVMPCGHRFHSCCLVRWLEQSFFCPLCRFPLEKDDD